MAETLVDFSTTVVAPEGKKYEARACGSEMPGGTWQGWIEFIPCDGGEPVRTGRETTQPNRIDTQYWATGLTQVYLEGALRRALARPWAVPVIPPQPAVFNGPAAPRAPAVAVTPGSILNPFSVYEKGEALLRNQLAALSAWHLVNIVLEYELSKDSVEKLNRLPAKELIEMIVSAVRREVDRPVRKRRR